MNKWTNKDRRFAHPPWEEKWPEYTHYIDNHEKLLFEYLARRDWIYDNVENCEKHARWQISYTYCYIQVNFRYERDMIRYILRWS